MKTLNPYITLSIIILLSVLIRIPNINRPLSKHNEFNAAMVLNVCNSWYINGGAAYHNYTPTVYYGNPADYDYTHNVGVYNGKFYYPSMGSMQFVLPYYFCLVLGLPFTPLSLSILAMLLSCIAIFLFYNILELLSPHGTYNLWYTLLFSLLPNMLWYFGNAYSHESLALVLYMAMGYYGILFIYKKKTLSVIHSYILAALVIVGILSDWLMVLVAATFVCIYLYQMYLTKAIPTTMLYVPITIILASIVAVLLMVTLYSQQLTIAGYIALMKEKFLSRTYNGSSSKYNTITILRLLSTYILLNYGMLLGTCIFFCIKKTQLHHFKCILCLLIPPLLYTILLPQFAAENEYSVHKLSMPIMLLFATATMRMGKLYFYTLATSILCIHIGIYYFINRPGTTNHNGDAYNAMQVLGYTIKNKSTPTDHILVLGTPYNYAAVMYYAKRNIVCFSTQSQIDAYLTKHQITTYKIFTYPD